ncbi:MAG: hypothetical protein KatS3mg081_1290 [Gemmatimonadales bacterium]|nr:MAG: hypothetical protein KatS3mg081_1290 [Gemmatimonadales bacterium]
MFATIQSFLDTWRRESAATARLMAELTDRSLYQRIADGYRSLGELAWHIVVSQREIVRHTGLEYRAPSKQDPQPLRAAEIHSCYVDAAKALAEAVESRWSDETLAVLDRVYDQQWPRGLTLAIMLYHEIHHRGQMTVLMRQAGLRVPGVYGPSRDEER